LHKVAETLSTPVRHLNDLLTKDELNAWLSYFTHKEPAVEEVQLAILISSVRNALGGKATPRDFIFSGKAAKVKENEDEEYMTIGNFKPIKKCDLKSYMKPML